MGPMAYRGDLDALVAQCEALKQRLTRAQVDARELERLSDELRDKTREVERLRGQLDPALVARRRRRLVGLTAALGACVGVAS